MTTPYDRLAAEYYDPELHPTCDDFRRASAALIDQFLDRLTVPDTILLELGAGRSLLAERWLAAGRPPRPLLLTDSSAGMLLHSRPLLAVGAMLAVAEAARQPLADMQAGLICSALGDSYNCAATWTEIRRVLHPNGACIYTTPSFAWARHFRPRHQDGELDAAHFLVGGRVAVALPSHVLSERQQSEMLRGHGLRVVGVRHVTRVSIPGGARSPKLMADGFAETEPVTTGYLIRRTT